MRDARDVLKRPVISEKSVGLIEENKYSFWVDTAANKIEIKAAVEKMFKVKVVDVRTINVDGKKKRVGKHVGRTADRKKAIVTLKAGDRIEGFAGL
ncbi:LSU ribosomal protein L23P [Desulfitobacterium sp. LBE]|uniref:Large ribosomal subunit protein uL23 n=5 Tax=root TaxID=1 RepID=RL23_DESHY|nr:MULTISPECIES: 50S ribosomal protein L23 [Desulfitobacterium]Q250N0.1 RecName: Full=Large ribosomal subunit protein uL23; AltName: Full=50S ribosomal protein L23 [Desulfitobacterium hafniense Y51]EHL07890.1 ribosomal protein L23 [Desulfitobacterium hafniense DP7]KTE92900.1 50S ribosomal protein L23 [Desulfitobacterium hafniense]MEA5023769.1 50S ribosomal protein L23 [Desulfitobacterium hafniense]TWH58583.1 LSU ribosomal protein L23P [Desulfitobacterium sp. LBE]CDX00467.1 50S ribosomal prote